MEGDDGVPRRPDGGRRPATHLRQPSTPGRTSGPPRAARQESLRKHNLHLVLGRILDADAPVSRADIAAATGLTRGAVSALVDRLIAAHLVAELAPVLAQRVGRPAVPLVPARGTVVGLGAEVNVDYIGVRAVDLSGEVLARRQVTGDFRGSDPIPVLGRLAELTGEVLDELGRPDAETVPRVAGLGVALPGLVDRVTGPLRLAPNLGWRDVDVVGLLRAHAVVAGIPVRLANEANLAARAELRTGPRDHSFLYVSGEVGIGAAIVLDGAVYAGRHGWSGELGHTVVEPDGPRCSCGATGCLERYAGKDALMRAAGLELALPVDALLAAADAGDPAALASLAEGGRALGVAVANFVNLVDVEQVVLGGIYAGLADHLEPAVTEQLRERVLAAPWATAGVRPARAGAHAAMQGAALAVLATVVEDPAAWLLREAVGSHSD